MHFSIQTVPIGAFIVTIRNIWSYNVKRYLPLTADCPFCGHRFEPDGKYIATIKAILRNANIGHLDSPCLKRDKRAWDESGLFSKCNQNITLTRLLPEAIRMVKRKEYRKIDINLLVSSSSNLAIFNLKYYLDHSKFG